MDRLYHHRQQDQHPQKSAHPLGTVVFCIHCFRTLGTETAATPREVLIAKHNCAESLLAKKPGAPPPFN
jgi:hypothetical protein